MAFIKLGNAVYYGLSIQVKNLQNTGSPGLLTLIP